MTPAAKPREHTTHFDDCGCLSERHAREIADANTAIRRLQKRLDAVRPVVAAVIAWRDGYIAASEYYDAMRSAVDALPAADREWATKGE